MTTLRFPTFVFDPSRMERANQIIASEIAALRKEAVSWNKLPAQTSGFDEAHPKDDSFLLSTEFGLPPLRKITEGFIGDLTQPTSNWQFVYAHVYYLFYLNPEKQRYFQMCMNIATETKHVHTYVQVSAPGNPNDFKSVKFEVKRGLQGFNFGSTKHAFYIADDYVNHSFVPKGFTADSFGFSFWVDRILRTDSSVQKGTNSQELMRLLMCIGFYNDEAKRFLERTHHKNPRVVYEALLGCVDIYGVDALRSYFRNLGRNSNFILYAKALEYACLCLLFQKVSQLFKTTALDKGDFKFIVNTLIYVFGVER